MARVNFHAFQIDMHFYEIKDGKHYDRIKWSAADMEDILNHIMRLSPVDKRVKFNGWLMYLDELTVRKKYIIGRFKYAEYGFKSPLIHADTLQTRENPRDLREGEEKHVHFYVRKSDGLFLIQGHLKVNQFRISEYIEKIAKRRIEQLGFTYLFLASLIDVDFFERISALEKVSAISLEVSSKEPTSVENEVVRVLQQNIEEMKGTHVQMTFKAKRLRRGLKDVIPFVGKYNGMQGITNIKVEGEAAGATQTVFVDEYREKYKYDCPTDDNNVPYSVYLYRRATIVGRTRRTVARTP